jgi:predicted MPP superfamily phosphohydrolase
VNLPPSLADAAEWAAKTAARHGAQSWPNERRPFGIHLRRFAGPVAYRKQISHLRVAHLTDLHVGRITPFAVQRAAVEMTNAERPDLVVLTGDFVCHSQLYLDQLIEVVSGFSAPTIAVLGNHDYWSGAAEVERALRRGGVEVLKNRHTVLSLRGERLQVLGLDDAYTSHCRRDEAVKGLRHDLPVLGLSHIAEEADGLWRHGVPLVLSGHTHGGQVTLARLHELTVGKIAGHRYVHGLYGSRGGRQSSAATPSATDHANGANGTHGSDGAPEALGAVYVGAGIGAAVMPLRIGNRGKREVTIFELGAEPGSFDEHHGEQTAMPGRKPSAAKVAKRAAAVLRKRLWRERRQDRVKLDV